jgi:hypothetical protein
MLVIPEELVSWLAESCQVRTMDGANYVHMEVTSQHAASGLGAGAIQWDQGRKLRAEEADHGFCGSAC